eukprot:TRINITY_DN7671_c1_g1_i1.p1 TRINITY_DN7671_c1_g1~~TRINITY_DN7671_c1_g1_i1.p1  ORF type:complete len:478 (-),score=179.54 TRINITY_DN7671_c1_g1_i1:122-1555(-)
MEIEVKNEYENILEAINQLQYALEPIPKVPIQQWPGNTICVSCNFALSCLLIFLEILFFMIVLRKITLKLTKNKVICENKSNLTPITSSCCKKSKLCLLIGLIGTLFSIFGWLYWFSIFLFFWNFISWLMLIGPILVLPGLIQTIRKNKGSTRKDLLCKRLKLAGFLFGILTIVMFPNLKLMPEQFYRHLNPAYNVITPNDMLVENMVIKFYTEIPRDKFSVFTFEEQMLLVDKFIYRNIEWKSDYEQYKLVGLLTTPHEVIERMAGDCQGQAVVTASMLINMGFNAWVVETPFHWWTHAEDKVTGRSYNLNTHGGAGEQGNVVPQPIDLIYTRPKDACSNCSDMYAQNTNTALYTASPIHAFMIAFTGTHIFVRSHLSFEYVNLTTIIAIGLVFGLITGLYATYYQSDFNCSEKFKSIRTLIKRLIISIILSIVFFSCGLIFWTTIYYPAAMIHLVLTGTLLLSFISSDFLNLRLQ